MKRIWIAVGVAAFLFAHGRGAALDRPCGGFGAEGVAVSLSPDSEKWAEKVEVKNGNIFLTVRPMGLMIICE